MVRFLIDECLSPYLVARAQHFGYEAQHVFRQGMAGWADWRLVAFAVEQRSSFVTNNRSDFRRLYSQLDEHSGLMVMLEATRVERQIALFTAALDAISRRPDLANSLVEIDRTGSVTLTEFRKV